MRNWRGEVSLFMAAWMLASAAPTARAGGILQILVVEGEGAVHGLGARSTRPLVVQVTDETGQPVAGAAVSFRLPEEGPSGVFASGLRTEVTVSGADGKAAVWGIQWNRTPGSLQVRVTAVKGDMRAGILVEQHISESAQQAPKERDSGYRPPRRSGGRLAILLALVAGGAAAGGAAYGLTKKKASAAAPAAVPAIPLQIGQPSISVGRP